MQRNEADGPCDSAMGCFLLESVCQIRAGSVLLVGMDKGQEGLPDERSRLIVEMASEDRIQIDEGEF